MVKAFSMSEVSTQERIKAAAAKVFTMKGLEGARMQDIADEANINKAMLHYYFKNKQQLFQVIFEEKATKVFSALDLFVHGELSFHLRISKFVEAQISIFSEFPTLPLFVLMEVRKNPALLEATFRNIPLQIKRSEFQSLVENEISVGNIRKVDPQELLLNIIALCVYPIIAEPIFRFLSDMDEIEYRSFINRRKDTITALITNDLFIKK